MAMPFEVFTDHYALQWLKTMRTGSALLHRWSAALEEYDFTVRHCPGKAQIHVDGLSRLPVGPAPPEDTLLHVHVLHTRRRLGNWPKSYIPRHILAVRLYGSYSVTDILTKPTAASA